MYLRLSALLMQPGKLPAQVLDEQAARRELGLEIHVLREERDFLRVFLSFTALALCPGLEVAWRWILEAQDAKDGGSDNPVTDLGRDEETKRRETRRPWQENHKRQTARSILSLMILVLVYVVVKSANVLVL